MTFFYVGFWLTVGNFFYQALQSQPDWGAAGDRSYFQSIAILGVWLALRMRRAATMENNHA